VRQRRRIALDVQVRAGGGGEAAQAFGVEQLAAMLASPDMGAPGGDGGLADPAHATSP
jgi:hypothetical protein